MKGRLLMKFTNLEECREAARQCTACPLCRTRTQAVFGTGNPNAEVMLIGEGPGEHEDLQGEPFVGKSGQLLDKMLAVIDLNRKTNVYIANIVKCRPPQNRDPLPEEQDACIQYLRSQVAIIRPKIIVCLGRIAACRIIDPNFKVTKQHGQWIERNGIHMSATYHPSALLRYPQNKQIAFTDFLSLRDKIHQVCTSDLYIK